MADGDGSVGLEGYLLLEGVLVEGELLLIVRLSGFPGFVRFIGFCRFSAEICGLGLRSRGGGFLEFVIHLLEEGDMII